MRWRVLPLSTAGYILVAIQLKEHDLLAAHGEEPLAR